MDHENYTVTGIVVALALGLLSYLYELLFKDRIGQLNKGVQRLLLFLSLPLSITPASMFAYHDYNTPILSFCLITLIIFCSFWIVVRIAIWIIDGFK